MEYIADFGEDVKEDTKRSEVVSTLVDQFARITYAADQSKNAELDLHEYNEKLAQLLNAIERQEYDLFADLLEYEVRPLLEFWMTRT